MGTSKLGNMLVEDGLLSESDRRTIKRTCGTGGSAFARGILAMGLLDEDELAAYIAEHTSWKVAAKNLVDTVQAGAWGCVDRPLVEQLEVLPVRLAGDTLHVAMIDPLDLDTISQLEFFSGYKILPIIATMTQVRTGLLKFLPDYEAAHSQLEVFLKNHSFTASKRVRMADESLYDDLPPPESFSVRGFEEPRAAAPSVKKAGQNIASTRAAPNQADNEEIEFTSGDDMETEEISDGGFGESSNVDDGLGFSDSEDSGDGADDLFSIEEESISESGDKPASVAALEMDGFGSDDDDDIVFDDPLLEPDVDLKAAPAGKPKVEQNDDFESLMDLSDFDPDKTISDDDLDFDPNPKAKKQTAPAVDIDAPLEFSESLESDIDTELSADLNADFSSAAFNTEGSADDLFAESDSLLLDESTGSIDDFSSTSTDLFESVDSDSITAPDLDGELTADFSAMSVDESEDLDIEGFGDAKDNSAMLTEADETDFSFDSVDEKAIASSDDDILSLDTDANLDMLSEDDAGSLLEETPESSFESVSAATHALLANSAEDEENTDVDTSTQSLSMNINKMFFQVSMATETKSAIGAIASDLKATGFSTGMVIGGSASSQFRPECGWLDSQGGNQQATTAVALQEKGITAALGRLPSAWTPLDDAVRGGDLKVFASLQRANKKLYGIKFSDGTSKNDTVIVTAMASEISDNESLMQMAADLFKQVAAKNKGAA